MKNHNTMRNTFVFMTILASMLFFGCDRIESPYLTLSETEEVTVDFPDLDINSVYRKVLIEEFTGHRCLNCPTGHQKLEELHGLFGDTLVIVGIHAGALAAPKEDEGYPYDFRTEVGNELAQEFNIDGIPAAIINRYPQAGGWGPARWLTKINAVDRSKPLAAIQLINEYNAQTGMLKANAQVTLLEPCSNQLRLAFYLIEDGIVKPQLNGTEYIENYVHNHVLRASLNGTYGTLLNTNGYLETGKGYTLAHKINLSGLDWNPANCTVVAILYDRTAGDVLQVESQKVM